MKFLALTCCVVFTQAYVVRREADAEADPDAFGFGYGSSSPASVSSPVCNSVPQKVCKDRTVETPRKVCHTEHDEIIDTTITEHCEETVTTKCEQVSSQTRHSSAVVGADSKVVATGLVASPEVTVAHGASTGGAISSYGAVSTGVISGYGAATSGSLVGSGANLGYASGYGYGGLAHTHAGYGKREADADAFYGASGYSGASPVSTSAPVCNSVPVRTCNKVPVNTPRKVAKTVCKTVVDVKIIKDCTDTVSTTCTQKSVQQSHSSAVVGADTKVGPSAVVANHGTISVGSAVGGYSGGAVIGSAAPVIGGYAGGAAVNVASPIISGYTGAVTGYGAAGAPVISGYTGAGTGYGVSGYAGDALIGASVAPVAADVPVGLATSSAAVATPVKIADVAAPVKIAAAPVKLAAAAAPVGKAAASKVYNVSPVATPGCVNSVGASVPCA